MEFRTIATPFSITDKGLRISQQERKQGRNPDWSLGYRRNTQHCLASLQISAIRFHILQRQSLMKLVKTSDKLEASGSRAFDSKTATPLPAKEAVTTHEDFGLRSDVLPDQGHQRSIIKVFRKMLENQELKPTTPSNQVRL